MNSLARVRPWGQRGCPVPAAASFGLQQQLCARLRDRPDSLRIELGIQPSQAHSSSCMVQHDRRGGNGLDTHAE